MMTTDNKINLLKTRLQWYKDGSPMENFDTDEPIVYTRDDKINDLVSDLEMAIDIINELNKSDEEIEKEIIETAHKSYGKEFLKFLNKKVKI